MPALIGQKHIKIKISRVHRCYKKYCKGKNLIDNTYDIGDECMVAAQLSNF
jgi:hypothetical protein